MNYWNQRYNWYCRELAYWRTNQIFFKIKDKVFDYLCQFNKKEADYIIHFYNILKNTDYIDPALYAAYLGTQ